MPEPTTYEIVLRGRASERLLRPLIDDFTISHDPDGVTSLIGDIHDPSHLHGVLAHLTSVNTEIISINPINQTTRNSHSPRRNTNDSHDPIHNRHTDSNNQR